MCCGERCIKGEEEGASNERSSRTKQHRSIANPLQRPSPSSHGEQREESKRTCADQNERTKEDANIYKMGAFSSAQEDVVAQLCVKGSTEEEITYERIRERIRSRCFNAEKGGGARKVEQRMDDGWKKEEEQRESEQRNQHHNGQQRSPRDAAQRVHASTRTRPCSHHDLTESGSGATRPSRTAARVTAAWKSPHSLSASA